MNIKKISENAFVTFFVLSVIILFQSGCKLICSTAQYRLTGGVVTMKPDQDSIKVGDTLWISSFIPKNLLEINTTNNQTIDFSNASNVSTEFNLLVPVSKGNIIGAIDSFEYIPVKGSLLIHPSSPKVAKVASYAEENDGYHLTLGLKAQKRGIYCFTLIDIFKAEKKCTTASIETLLNNADNHSYYLNISYYPGSPYGDTISEIVRTHTYCFKVY